jgi:hypothetical protein
MPTDPAVAAAARRAEQRAAESDPARWGEAPATATDLKRMSSTGVRYRLDQRGRVASAVRSDVFGRLADKGALTIPEAQAIRRLEEDFALRARIGAKSYSVEQVDRSDGSAAVGVTDGMIDAGDRVVEALSTVGPLFARLLVELLERPLLSGKAIEWREIVASVSGETRKEGQSCVVRMAAKSLAEVYDTIDHRERQRKRRGVGVQHDLAAKPQHVEGERVRLRA